MFHLKPLGVTARLAAGAGIVVSEYLVRFVAVDPGSSVTLRFRLVFVGGAGCSTGLFSSDVSGIALTAFRGLDPLAATYFEVSVFFAAAVVHPPKQMKRYPPF